MFCLEPTNSATAAASSSSVMEAVLPDETKNVDYYVDIIRSWKPEEVVNRFSLVLSLLKEMSEESYDDQSRKKRICYGVCDFMPLNLNLVFVDQLRHASSSIACLTIVQYEAVIDYLVYKMCPHDMKVTCCVIIMQSFKLF